MEQEELSGYELYEILALIRGLNNPNTIQFLGFVNEKELTEGTKRLASRVAKTIADEVEILNKQRLEIQNYKDESISEQELKNLRISKDSALMQEKIKINIEKLDFSKIENLKLSENYLLLYEKIFK